ncbi:MAG: hypothetical protein RL344_338 [Pseudomonadota bacterium]|jgi:uncharacterized membrane protein (UPF0127 family)
MKSLSRHYLKTLTVLILSITAVYAKNPNVKTAPTSTSTAKPEVTMEDIYKALLKNPPTFEIAKVKLGNKLIEVEVADTLVRQIFGLMGRTNLPKDTGMLFFFKKPIPICFWMKDTPLPLSIGFLDEEGILLSHEDMEPFSETQHCSKQPVKYVLEINKGWFEENNIAIGEQLTTE